MMQRLVMLGLAALTGAASNISFTAEKSPAVMRDQEATRSIQTRWKHMRRAAIFLVLTAFAISAAPTQASEISTKEEVVAMVHRVQEKYKKDGLEATVAAANDKSTSEFHDRDLYVFIYNMQGICLANGARPALVGKNLISLKDQDGNFLIQQMVTIATGPGSGWLSYKWPSPVTNKIEDRSAYIEKMGDYFVGVGMDR